MFCKNHALPPESYWATQAPKIAPCPINETSLHNGAARGYDCYILLSASVLQQRVESLLYFHR